MAANKYLKLNTSTGNPAEQAACQSSAGVANANEIGALDSTGRFNENMMPLGIVPETIAFTAAEALSAGNYINLFLNSGVLKGQKADNSNGRRADCFVTASVSNGGSGTGYTDGTNANLSGLAIGSRYFLATAGGVTDTVPSAGAGVIVQPLGIAKSTTELVTTFDNFVIERAA